MANFERRVWKAGDPELGASELNRIEAGIEEALNGASFDLDIGECEATTVKGVVEYINELVSKLKGV